MRLVLSVAIVLVSTSAYAQCLHGPDETAEQAARRRAALTATRTVNIIQANQPLARNGVFLPQLQLAVSPYALAMARSRDEATAKINLEPDQDILPGWKLTLDVTEKGYWFMIQDKTDKCGFAYISNQNGIIYPATYLQ